MTEEQQTLPKGWIAGHIEDVCTHPQYGWTCKASNTGKIKLLRTTDISSGSLNWDTVPYCTALPKNPEDYFLKAGDIVVSRAGSVGKSFLIRQDIKDAVFASYLVRFKPFIENRYILYFMQSWKYWEQIEDKSAGIAVPNVNASKLSKIKLPIAPLNEQKRIVSKIDELFSDLDKGEENLRKAQRLLATYRQSVLKAAVTGTLVNSDSKDWPEYTLGELLLDIRYGTAKKCLHDPNKTPVLRIPNVVSGRIDLTDLKHTDFEPNETGKLALRVGDVLLVRSNGSASLVGRSAVITTDAEGFAYAGYLIRLRLKMDRVLPDYLQLFLQSPSTRALIERQARSTSGVHNINSDEIRNLVLKLPSIAMQAEIVDKVDDIFSQISTLEAWCETELKRSATLRQSILKSAFSGKLVPQDASDEPASELLKRIHAERDIVTSEPKQTANRGRPKREAA